ncbi:MAG: putative lipid II flippase FtsW [Candidatus Saccharibacteria bacterium]
MRLKQGPPDIALFLTILALLCIGLIMVFSSSAVKSGVNFNDEYYFVKRQLLWAVIGIGVLIVAMKFNYEKLRHLGLPALIFAVLCLIAVLIPGLGKNVLGATRQLNLGPASFSPSELTKTCLILFFAANLPKHMNRLKDFTTGLLPYLVIVGIICGLIMLQPDLGTTVVIAATAFLLLMVAGAKWSHLVGLAGLGASLVGLAIWLEPFRMARFIAFWDPWKYAKGFGFQTIQSLYALGSGGLFGVGLGQSRQKFFYLPEQHTDFIFAIFGEELGYLGVILVIALFVLFIWRGFRIALKAPDAFGSLLAAGITIMVSVQAAINMLVVSGSMPVTGIPLPFISYGGASLIFTLAAIGLLLNVSRYADNR